MRDRKTLAVLIAGPTASGKSALALAVAEKIGGVIVNADSMQVYRDLRIITARPMPDDESRAPHRLYGHIDAAENYSVGRWCTDAAAALAEARRVDRVPIVVGGTGLYFKALTRGLAAIPPIPAAIRSAVRARLGADGVADMHGALMQSDPASAARLNPADRARIARAMEVFKATGRSIVEWQADGMTPILDSSHAAKIFLTPERAALKQRIDGRFESMLEDGALDEVRALDARRLAPLLPAMKAHGVPWLRRVLHGELSLADAATGGKADTRRYAKRQVTWFRHQLPDWPQVPPESAMALLNAQMTAMERGGG